MLHLDPNPDPMSKILTAKIFEQISNQSFKDFTANLVQKKNEKMFNKNKIEELK